MPKVRRRNAGASDRRIDDYLICGKRHNQPRIHHRICEEACKKRKRCVFYKSWYEVTHEEEINKAKEEANKKRAEARLLKKSMEEQKLAKKVKRKSRKTKIKKVKRVKKVKTQEA
jgi:hypothetical protein